MRAARLAPALTLALALAALGACTGPPEGAPATTAGDAGPDAVIPDEAPSIEGLVTEVGDDGRVLVEEDPAERSGSKKAWVTLTDDTAIRRRSAAPASRSDLVPGTRVSVWFTGPVLESYPLQATAGVVVIEDRDR
ncbi:MAG: DUF3221 domain-containing protein [Gemmatimonadota bacterium]